MTEAVPQAAAVRRDRKVSKQKNVVEMGQMTAK